ncbi:transcription elongation factor spt5 [Marasmius tenuissimus]|uniref:Transcription elongation factor SPT5 n=1 Tax=Marasmius tenuissimus TaxID=585030 RepID=A0ABR2ZRC7_9AGAR
MSDLEDHVAFDQDDNEHEQDQDDGQEAAPRHRKLYDDDEDDEEDEDEDDDEDEEEEEERSGKKGKKRVKRRHKRDSAARFLDVEAEVSSDDEDEDDEGEFANDGFIETNDHFDDDSTRRHHALLDSRRQFDEDDDKSPEQIARDLSQRYRRTAVRYTGDMNEIPQRLLMPSVHDASLWQVRVKPGRERDIVVSLMRKAYELEASARPLQILSAFQRDSLPGMIYIEARSSQHVTHACNGLVGVYPSRGVHLVPIEEMASLLQIKKQEATVQLHSWVRIRRGKYQGDLAQVVDVDNVEEIGIRFVPRIDLNPRDDGTGTADGKKRKKPVTATGTMRPPQRLFNFEEVVKVHGRSAVSKRNAVYVFQGDTFKDGFIEKDFKPSALIMEDVNPTLEEITQFSNKPDGISGDSMVDLSIIAEASRKQAVAVLQPGDHVEVFEGEQAGVHGVVEEISQDVVTITPVGVDIEGQKVDLPARSVRKRFKPGDHVKVMAGKNADETGLVVSVADNVVTFLSDMSMQEVSVFSKDLREAAEVGASTNIVGDYELHDLVQLDPQTVGVIYKTERDSFRVLDQNGQARLVRPHQISMRRDSNRAIATDSEGHELRINDNMKENDGEGRKGRVLHIHQSFFAFLHNREITENGGVFVTRARSLVSLAPKSNPIKLAPGADLSKMNPALAQPAGGMVGSGNMGRGPRDRLIGVGVTVIKGPHKGYNGIVKDTNGPVARVELNTGNKVISIEKGKLHRRLPNGKTEPLEGPGATWGRNNNNNSMGPPSSIPNRTSNPYAGGGGGRTPGWGGGGGRTPAWGGGGRTPNPYAAGDSRTPAWNASSRTPNPYASSQTPAWNASSRTPNPYAADGGRTPAWQASSRTPNPYANGGATPGRNTNQGAGSSSWGGATPGRNAWGSGSGASDGWGGATPGRSDWSSDVWNAPTPASAPTPSIAPTPAPYATAPTPAFSSFGMGGMSAPTPGVFPETPGAVNFEEVGRVPHTPDEDWILDPQVKPHYNRLKVTVHDTIRAGYLDGAYENRAAVVLTASRAGEGFDQTAYVKFVDDGQGEERSIMMKYLLPFIPDTVDEEAVVISGPRKGELVKVRQRPDSNESTELVVVESVGTNGAAFWECQKDWMCALSRG